MTFPSDLQRVGDCRVIAVIEPGAEVTLCGSVFFVTSPTSQPRVIEFDGTQRLIDWTAPDYGVGPGMADLPALQAENAERSRKIAAWMKLSYKGGR